MMMNPYLSIADLAVLLAVECIRAVVAWGRR